MGVLNAIKYVTDPQLSTDDAQNPYALQQRQQLINALKSQATNPAQLQSAGAIVPTQSWITPLAQALSGYYAGKMQNSQDTAMKGLADKKSAASQALIQSLYGQQQQSSPQQAPDPAQQGPQASQMPSPVASMFNSPQQSVQAPQQAIPQPTAQTTGQAQSDNPFATPQQRIIALTQGMQNGTLDPELGKQLLTQAQKDATPAKDYTLGDNRFSGRTNQMIAQAPSGDATKPSDELAKLSQDLKNGFITQADYNARRNLMTTRAPNMYTQAMPTNGDQPNPVAKMIASYELPPISPMRMSTPQGQALMAQVSQLNPDYQGEEYPTRVAAYKAFASGKQGDQVRSFNVMLSHLNTASDLADQLNNTASPAFNKAANFFATQTGSAAPTNMDTALQMIKAEAVKAISGAGGGVSDREQALAAVNNATSPAAIKGALDTVKKLAGGQLGGIKRQYEASTGRKDFEHLLSPDALPYLNTKEGTGDSNFNANGQTKTQSGATVSNW